jgi:hypothetical protein
MREIGPVLIALLIPLSVVALVNAGAAQPADGAGTTAPGSLRLERSRARRRDHIARNHRTC